MPLTGGCMGDHQLVTTTRVMLVVFTGSTMLFALNSKASMYEMVQSAHKVTLVAAFTPLAQGMFWRGATPQGAGLSIVLRLSMWILMEAFAPNALLPPQHVGLGAALFGMVAGSLAPQVLGGRGHPEVVDEAVTGRPAHPHGHGERHTAGSQTGVCAFSAPPSPAPAPAPPRSAPA